MTLDDYVTAMDQLLANAKKNGIDHELLLAKLYAKHLASDERCDKCHVYGITFAEKLNELMEEATNGG